MLTKKEQDIIDLLRANPYMGNVRVAALLGKSESTIENQLRSIYAKLGFTGSAFAKRARLIDWARGVGEYKTV